MPSDTTEEGTRPRRRTALNASQYAESKKKHFIPNTSSRQSEMQHYTKLSLHESKQNHEQREEEMRSIDGGHVTRSTIDCKTEGKKAMR